MAKRQAAKEKKKSEKAKSEKQQAIKAAKISAAYFKQRKSEIAALIAAQHHLAATAWQS